MFFLTQMKDVNSTFSI